MSASPIQQKPLHGPVLAVCRADGSTDEADIALLKRARHAADAMGAPLIAVGVVQPPADLKALAKAMGISRQTAEARLAERLNDQLSALCARAALDESAPCMALLGKPFLELIRTAIKHEAGLVLKTAETLSGPRSAFFASTDQHLLRKCPSPVWLVREDGANAPRTVLAAVDLDPLTADQPKTQAALNRRILETAGRLAALSQAQLHLLHVWDAPGEGLVRLWANDKDEVEAYLDEIRDHHRAALERFMKDARQCLAELGLDAVRVQPRLVRGDPRAMIPSEVEAFQADTLVMGTIARTGVPGFIIGNTAEDVLNSVECGVVTVKPPGYVSPVS